MAYNNYPMNYQQYYPQYQTQTQNNGIIWVQGEAGAKSYMVAPNNTVQLWDSEKQVIYLKSADASGMPSMRVLDYTIRDQVQGHNPVTDNSYATKDEIAGIKDEIEKLKETLKKYEEVVG